MTLESSKPWRESNAISRKLLKWSKVFVHEYRVFLCMCARVIVGLSGSGDSSILRLCVVCACTCVWVPSGSVVSSPSPVVCLLLATVHLPSHLMLQHITSNSTKLYFLSLPFLYLQHSTIPLLSSDVSCCPSTCLDGEKMPTASNSLPFLCLREWNCERRGLTPINISLAHIVNGFNTYKRLHSAQHDCVIELIATAVREVLQRDAIMLKHSPVMHEWVDISRNLLCNTVNTEDILVERGWGEVSHPVVVLPRQQLHSFCDMRIIYSGEGWLMGPFFQQAQTFGTEVHVLHRMNPKLTSIWIIVFCSAV